MKLQSAAITNIGQHRKMNQDSFFLSDDPVGNLPDLYLVADGMGGHKAGDYASSYVTEHVVDQVKISYEKAPARILDQAIHVVNRNLRTIAAANEDYYGMGTTCVAATLSERTLTVANVGDSRLYIADPAVDGIAKLHQITVDHSLVEEMVLAGGIDETKARTHPNKNIITRAIGAEDTVDIDYFTVELAPGQKILMCTDGLTNMVEDDRIGEIIGKGLSTEETCHLLVTEANRNGGRDNITVVLIDPYCTVLNGTENIDG